MAKNVRFISFCWWNLHNFAHFDRSKTGHKRWPKSRKAYERKRDRIIEALQQLFKTSYPHLLAVCEITRAAARDLAVRLPPGYLVALPTVSSYNDGFHVAVFYLPGMGFTSEVPIIPSDHEDVRAGTRQMIPVHLKLHGHLVRFVACHWTAFDNHSTRVIRQRLADVLRRDCHEFLEPAVPTPGLARHVVILGDLNEEPTTDLFRERLLGFRDRESSRSAPWQDAEVRQARFYNAAWRFLGEQIPLGGPNHQVSCAGTYYNDSDNAETRGWRTFDHIILSRELLGQMPPYLDEVKTAVASTAIMRKANGRPEPFVPGNPTGVSDHLPVIGRLVV